MRRTSQKQAKPLPSGSGPSRRPRPSSASLSRRSTTGTTGTRDPSPTRSAVTSVTTRGPSCVGSRTRRRSHGQHPEARQRDVACSLPRPLRAGAGSPLQAQDRRRTLAGLGRASQASRRVDRPGDVADHRRRLVHAVAAGPVPAQAADTRALPQHRPGPDHAGVGAHPTLRDLARRRGRLGCQARSGRVCRLYGAAGAPRVLADAPPGGAGRSASAQSGDGRAPPRAAKGEPVFLRTPRSRSSRGHAPGTNCSSACSPTPACAGAKPPPSMCEDWT